MPREAYDVFDPVEADAEESGEHSMLLRLPLAQINKRLWWTGLRVGVDRTHGQGELAVAWFGPEIWKRFKEWKR